MSRKKMAVSVAVAVGALSLASSLGGCSQKFHEQFRDAPVSSHDNSPARVIEDPDGFSNVSAKCDGPNMLYVAYHGDGGYASIAVAPNDPRCAR